MNSFGEIWRGCGWCHGLRFPALHNNYEDEVIMTIDQLRTAVSSGCKACGLVYEGLLAFYGAKALGPLTSAKVTIYKSLPMDTPMGVLLESAALGPESSHALQFYTHLDTPSLWPAIGVARNVSDDSSTEDCMSLARHWIDECISSHGHCSSYAPTPLPSRVLHVGNSEIEPFLHVTGNGTGEYAALSHCWGGKLSLKTTAETLKKRRSGIDFGSFPKTFQDAILICRALGLTYLWIDSLCIVQDSEDWELEAPKMVDYYTNAKITIAADGATNSLEGCFLSSFYRNNHVATVKSIGLGGAESLVYVRLGAGSADYDSCHLNPKARDQGYHSMLDTRAWTLQERILSPRILHYTAAELTWECATKRCCECSVQDWGSWANTLKRKLLGAYEARNSAISTVSGDSVRPEELENVLQADWQAMVRDFTGRELTFASDRLPAISGLAGAIWSITSDTYLAGLWKSELCAHLCWQTSAPSSFTVLDFKGSKRHSKYLAPSWSWASVTGRIFYDYTQGKQPRWKLIPRIEVHEATCVSAGRNQYGPASSGFIKCTGYVASVRLIIRKNDPNKHSKASRHSNQEEHVPYPEQRSFTVMPMQFLRPSGIFYPDVTDGSEVLNPGPYSMLIIASKDIAPGDTAFEKRTHQPFCIILKPSKMVRAAYERVGLATSETKHLLLKDESWADWLAVSSERTVAII